MTSLTIKMPDDVVRTLERLAAVQRKSIEQVALEQITSLIREPQAGSPEAVLRVIAEPPHVSAADVEELDAAILAGRQPVRARDLFSSDPS